MKKWFFAAAALLAPLQAFAAFHLMKVVEVFPGSPQNPNAQYVVLQMYAGGQSFVSGHSVIFSDAAGAEIAGSRRTFSASVANGANQDRILLATTEAQALFGITADLVMAPTITAGGGKICFDNIDCVAWGSFSGSTTGVGTPVNQQGGGLIQGSALIRKLGANNTLENADDTGNSNNDFLLGVPTPKNNARQTGTAAGACGNGTLDGAEGCDDNNTTALDGCNALCLQEFCGDGLDNDGAAEGCEDGNNVNTDACTNLCQNAACGDGILRAGFETCDDGNTNNGDGCSSACVVEVLASCGDGNIDAINGEECDDANTNSNDGCSSICKNEVCGDNIVQTSEQCDDGNEDANDGCDPACFEELCGDGVAQSDPNRPEQCDDGNAVETDACRNDCTNASCGDGVVQTGIETCDDGNLTNGDGCEDDCAVTQPIPEPEPSGGICAVQPASNSALASLAGLFALFAFAGLLRRRQ